MAVDRRPQCLVMGPLLRTLEHPHDMAAVFLQRDWPKTDSKARLEHLLQANLRTHTLITSSLFCFLEGIMASIPHSRGGIFSSSFGESVKEFVTIL